MSKFSLKGFFVLTLIAFCGARPKENTNATSTTINVSSSSKSTADNIQIQNINLTTIESPVRNTTTMLRRGTTTISTIVQEIAPAFVDVPLSDVTASKSAASPVPILLEPAGVERALESRAISGTSLNGNNKSDEFDGPVRRCNYNGDKDINKCLRQILEDLKPRLGAGIPEINLPPMDPLYLRSVSFHHGSGPIKILATFKDVNATGLSTFDKSDFLFDVKKRILDFDLTIPHMQIVGNYELSGNLFFFPVGGNGAFWLNLGGIKAKGQGKLGVSAKNNLKSIQIKKMDIDLEIETIKVHLSNLFHGDQLLGSVINNFLNENAKDIFDEVRPQIGLQVSEMVQLLSNKALASLSADHFTDIRLDSEI